MKKIIFIVVFFSITFSVYSDEWADLNKVFGKMYSLESFSFSLEVKLYKKNSDLKPELDYKGEARKKGKNFFSSIMGKSVMYNEITKELLHINDDSKTIVYSKNLNKDTLKKMSLTQKQVFQLDSAMFANCSARYLSNADNLISIEFTTTKNSKYKNIIIEIDPKTFLLKKVTYYPNAKNGSLEYSKVEISYSNFSINENIEVSYFDTEKYVSVNGNDVKLKPAYKNYKLVNQLKPQQIN